MKIIIFITFSESYIHIYKSVHIVSHILSISAIKASTTSQQRRQSMYLCTHTDVRTLAHTCVSFPYYPHPLEETRHTRISKSNKPTPDKRRARTCYVHLVTCSGKLGAARLVPLSPPFLFPPHSRLLRLHPLFKVQLVSTTRSAEPPQTGTMSRYCDPLQAAESCISSSMFPLPVSLPILTLPVPPRL